MALQTDGAYKLNEAHTVRAGLYLQTIASPATRPSQVLPTADQFLQA